MRGKRERRVEGKGDKRGKERREGKKKKKKRER